MAEAKKCSLFFKLILCHVLINSSVNCAFVFKHHNNEELASILDDVHKRCPNITRVYSLTENSVAGNPLLLIEFSDHPGQHEICKCTKTAQIYTNSNY